MLRDIINRNVVSCRPNASIRDVAHLMAKKNVGSVLVLDNGKPHGIITDRDIVVRCISKNLNLDECLVEDYMSESPKVIRETDGLFECIQLMQQSGIRRIPVVDEHGKAVSVISFGDLLAILSREFFDLTRSTTAAGEKLEAVAA